MTDLKIQNATDFLKALKELQIQFVSFRYTDPFGQLQHFTTPASQVDLQTFEQGLSFDGSSVRGWKSIEESDMILIPDPTTTYKDPFEQNLTLCVICSIFEPDNSLYLRDGRQIASQTLKYLKQTGFGDMAYFGPEAEFFIFDSLKYSNGSNHSFYEVDSVEGFWNTGKDEHTGYKPPYKGAYFTAAPLDKYHDIRLEMMKFLEFSGIKVEKGHSEVATGGQGEINIAPADLLKQADNMTIFKYVLRNTGRLYQKFVTFLPKPLAGDNGSGMHCNFSIWKDGQNQFVGSEYAGLSKTALYAIGGIIKHAKAIASFTNPTLNSYHRLVPGFEAPVNLAYSQRNRSTAIRIPIVTNFKATRIECRFPDPSSNPYLAFSALLCGAIDGIKNQIHPGDPINQDLFEMDSKKLSKIPAMPSSLEEALNSLKKDKQFLLDSGAFTQDFLDMWDKFKRDEIDQIRLAPHPKEFELYYDI
jgi:glutamine synthetase